MRLSAIIFEASKVKTYTPELIAERSGLTVDEVKRFIKEEFESTGFHEKMGRELPTHEKEYWEHIREAVRDAKCRP